MTADYRRWADTTWLAIPTITLHSFQHVQGEGKNAGLKLASLEVRLGDEFNISGYVLKSDPESKYGISYHSQDFSVRLLEVPITRKGSRLKTPLLADLINTAFEEACVNANGIREFIEGDGEPPQAEPFSPPSWGGKTIRVPIDYLEFYNIRAHTARGEVYSSVTIGGHFQIQNAKLLERRGQSVTAEFHQFSHPSVLSEEIRSHVNSALAGYGEFRRAVDDASARGDGLSNQQGYWYMKDARRPVEFR